MVHSVCLMYYLSWYCLQFQYHFLRIIYVTVISIIHDKLFGPYNKWTKICFLFIIYCPAFLLRNDVHSIHWNWLDNFFLCDVMAQVLFAFSLHYCYVKITIFHPVVSKIKLRFYLKPVNREYPYSSVGMRAAAIIAMCRTLCPYSPAHKILGNRTTYFSTIHACFQISRKLARCETNSLP